MRDKIRKFLEATGEPVTSLAQRAGVSRLTVHSYLNGKNINTGSLEKMVVAIDNFRLKEVPIKRHRYPK